MNIWTTVQYNKLEVILLNNFQYYAFQHVSEGKKKEEIFSIFFFYKESNPVYGTGTCVYMSKSILLVPPVATKTA